MKCGTGILLIGSKRKNDCYLGRHLVDGGHRRRNRKRLRLAIYLCITLSIYVGAVCILIFNNNGHYSLGQSGMLEVSFVGRVGTVLGLERDAWPMVKRTKASNT